MLFRSVADQSRRHQQLVRNSSTGWFVQFFKIIIVVIVAVDLRDSSESRQVNARQLIGLRLPTRIDRRSERLPRVDTTACMKALGLPASVRPLPNHAIRWLRRRRVKLLIRASNVVAVATVACNGWPNDRCPVRFEDRSQVGFNSVMMSVCFWLRFRFRLLGCLGFGGRFSGEGEGRRCGQGRGGGG